MSPKLKLFLQRWAITTVAVLVATYIVDGISSDSNTALIVASLVLGILNAVLRPIVLILSLPLLLFTLGLFTFVINAGLLWLTGLLVKPFHVESFGAAFFGGLIISIVTIILNGLTGVNEAKVQLRTVKNNPPPGPPPSKGGQGPVIDV